MARGRRAGFVIIFNHIPELIATVEAVSRAAPKRVADRVARDAFQRAAKDTGYMASTIEAVSIESGKVAEVRVGASYAGYQEYGTYKMPAHPFLTPAFDAHSKELGLELMAPLLGRR